MKTPDRHLAALFAAILSSGVAAAGNVFVVDPAGIGTYAQIQPAVDIALDGDTVLVKSGYYGGFAILDKQVNVVADVSAAAVVSGTIAVRSLSPGKVVVLSGLYVTGQYSSQPWEGHGLYLKNDAGSVRVQECTLASDNSFPAPASRHGALVEGCADVVFWRCTIVGGLGYWHTGGVVGSGLVASGSKVALYESMLSGGRGSDAAYPVQDGQGGGHACSASDGFVFASGSSFLGGRGGDGTAGGWGTAPPDGGNGGDGIHLSGPAARAELFQDVLVSGTGGAHGVGSASCPACLGADGLTGVKLSARRDQVEFFGGSRRILSTHSPVREMTNVGVAFDGEPGDTAFLWIAPASGFQFSAPFQGVLAVQAVRTTPFLDFGLVDPYTGNVSGSITFPDLGPGVQCRTFHLQSIHRNAQGHWVLGGTASMVVLDQAF